MALAAHILRLGVLVQGIFRNLGPHFQKVQLRSPMCLVATDAGHLATGKWIAASTHWMTLVGVSQAIVGGEGDGRHVARGNALRAPQVTLQSKLIHLRAQQVRIRRDVWIVAAYAIPRGVGKVRVQECLRLMTFKANDGLRRLDHNISCTLAVLDAVAGATTRLDRAMNVIPGPQLGVAFQAVRVFRDWSQMRTGLAQTRAQQPRNHHEKRNPRGERQRR